MSINVKIAKAHSSQLQDEDTKREIESISYAINNARIEYNDNAINFVFIKGIYSHAERKMITACLFVNKMQTITELHGVLRLRFVKENAVIATVTVDFDQEFMGEIENNEAHSCILEFQLKVFWLIKSSPLVTFKVILAM